MGLSRVHYCLLFVLLTPFQNGAQGAIVLNCPGGVTPRYSLDFVLLQDASHSFWSYMPYVQELLPTLFADLKRSFSARFGITAFVDKPVPSKGFGETGDYCYRQLHPLTADAKRAAQMFSKIAIGDGRDVPENQMGALLQAALDPEVNWTVANQREGLPVLRIIVLVTDAVSHEAGDYPKDWFQSPSNATDTPHTGRFDSDCGRTDYPSLAQVKAALHHRRVIPIILAVPLKGVMEYYQRALQDLGFSRDYVFELERGPNDIVPSIEKGLERVVCKPFPTFIPEDATTTTTTTAPNTTAPTTTAPTTAPTTSKTPFCRFRRCKHGRRCRHTKIKVEMSIETH